MTGNRRATAALPRALRLPLWLALCVALPLAATACDQSGGDSPAVSSGERPAEGNGDVCEPSGVAAGATTAAGVLDEGRAILPNGRVVAPEGDVAVVGNVSSDMALSPAGDLAYVIKQKRGLAVVDLTEMRTVQTLTGVRGYRGVAVAPGTPELVFAASMDGTVHRFERSDGNRLVNEQTVRVAGFPVDVVYAQGTNRLYVMCNTNSHIYEIDPATLEVGRTLLSGQNPYELVVDAAGERMWVSNLGSNSVSVIDVASGETTAQAEVCRNPEGLALEAAAGRLWVACSKDDILRAIDPETGETLESVDLTNDTGLTGAALNELHLAPDGGRLYASLARRNAVAVVDPATGSVLGNLATGHYPTELATTPDGERLVVIAAKGFGPEGGLDALQSHVNVVPLPTTPDELALATARVAENNARPGGFYPAQCGGELPPALAGGPDRPIQHVVLIVRENKTYDALLGDLEGTNGDPALAIFGEEITPNLHDMARTFANFDNFYSDAEHSLQGHHWTTQADCNDFFEKVRRHQLPLVGIDESTEAGGGSIFEHCYAHGVSFRNYGEFFGFGQHLFDELSPFIDHKFPFFNLAIPDVEKAAEFIRELEAGIFPEFVYIGLPNDHTAGTNPGSPVPAWYVGDNDAGTGMIVEAIARSPFWPSTAIFIIEDDPQGPGDHVHANRSICVVVSPHVRRNYTSSVLHSTASLYRTMEMLLELPPINRNSAEAAPMVDIFVTGQPGDEPDFTPFVGVPNPVPYAENTDKSPMAAESAAIDWTKMDEAPGLGLILWRAMRGDEPRPSYAKYIDE